MTLRAGIAEFYRLGAERAQTGESPWWDPRGGRLIWVDIRGNAVLEAQWPGGRTRRHPVRCLPSFVAPLGDDGLLVAAATGFWIIEPGRDAGRLLWQPGWLSPEHRFNDGVVDPSGRLVIGTLCLDRDRRPFDGALYIVTDYRKAVRVLDGFGIINGLAFSPDGRTLYVSDSHPDRRMIWACDYLGTRSGVPSLRRRRVFGDFALLGLEGVPDGACTDSEGRYLVAAHGAGEIVVFGPDGKLEARMKTGVPWVSKPAFAGDRLDRLAVTSFSSGGDHDDRDGGFVLVADCGMRGWPGAALRWPTRQDAGNGEDHERA